MTDPRFDWSNIDVVRYHELRSVDVRDYEASLPPLDELRATLEKWWDQTRAERVGHAFDLDGDFPATESLAHIIGPLGGDALAPLVSAVPLVLSGDVASDDLPERLARRLLAETLGRATARGKVSRDELTLSSDFAHAPLREWALFRQEFMNALTEAGDKKESWVKVLQDVPQNVERYLHVFEEERGLLQGLREKEDQFLTAPAPELALRTNNGDLRLDDGLRVQLEFLLDLDAGSWVRALDRVPSTPIIREIVDCSSIWRDRKLLLAALREAALVFEGDVPTGSRALFACIDSAITHAAQLESAVAQAARTASDIAESAVSELQRLRATELPAWFGDVFATLLRRRDGERVAVEFAVVLTGRADTHANAERPWSAAMAGLVALIQALGAHGLELRRTREIVRLAHRASEMPYLLIGVAVELKPHESDPSWAMRSDEVRAHAWNWYLDLLAASDEGVSADVNPYASVRLPFPTIGAVLAGWPDPSQRWEAAWTRLFEQRNHARFAHAPKLLDPSLHLVRVGIGTVDVLLGAKGPASANDERVESLWRSLLRSLQFLVTGQAGRLLQRGRLELARLFAYLPHVFGAGWRGEFERCWTVLAADERLALRAARNLLRQGVDRQILQEFFDEMGVDTAALGAAARFADAADPEPDVGDGIELVCREVLGPAPGEAYGQQVDQPTP